MGGLGFLAVQDGFRKISTLGGAGGGGDIPLVTGSKGGIKVSTD